jgi:hypothetical protein
VQPQEAKQILSHLARGSDPSVRIKALEALAKMAEREEAFRAAQPEPTLEESLAAIITLVPESGCGAFLALSTFIHSGAPLTNFPFLPEVAPIVARNFPTEWQKWRQKEGGKNLWVTDFLDRAAAGPVLEDDALIAAIKRKPSTPVKVKPAEQTDASPVEPLPHQNLKNQ